MDVFGSQAPSCARKTIIFVKNRNFYGYFKARQQITFTSRARNLHCLSKVTRITIKNSIFEDFYGFWARQLIKAEDSSIKNAEIAKNYGSAEDCNRADGRRKAGCGSPGGGVGKEPLLRRKEKNIKYRLRV